MADPSPEPESPTAPGPSRTAPGPSSRTGTAGRPTPPGPSRPGTAGHPAPAPTGPDRRGLLLGVGAYLLWGAMPLYFPLLEPAAPLEIIAHRVVWSLVFCVILLVATGGLGGVARAMRTPRTLGLLALAAVLVATNWTVYVYGVLGGHVLDAALGYFINPLVTVLFAVVVLKERLRRAQWVALAIGAGAVVVITVGIGRLPWIALTLAFTFGLYGLVKNRVGRDVEALPGLAVETAVLAPFALAYLGWLAATGTGTFGQDGWGHSLALMSAGIVTALPLLMFSSAARRLPLSLVGMLQYLAPVLQFLCGLLVFDEQMPPARWAGFVLVWVALVILSLDGLRAARATRLAVRAAVPPSGTE